MWTETISEKAYLGVTTHFLYGTEIISIDLACRQLQFNHTSAYLSQEINKIMVEWEINLEKVVSIITDNGANMVLAAEMVFPKKRVPCFAHTLNLVTTTTVEHPDVAETIKKVRSIVKFIKTV